MMRRFIFILLLFSTGTVYSQKKNSSSTAWSVRMAQSEMKRFPQAWMLDNAKMPRWGYHQGTEFKSMLDLWKHTGDKTYFQYVKGYGDSIITKDGIIKTYKMDSYNIDLVCAGKLLLTLYQETKDSKYKIAVDTLREQMRKHPRTSKGGFWHKLRYPHQMWLDGLYMGAPFLAQYARDFKEPALFDDVANQVKLMAKHTYDAKTGLYYHAWDESKEQKWANKETGQSPNFWGRSVGWFAMALVDVMDYMPKDHKDRKEIIAVIERVAAGIKKYQDASSGVWYQVLDQGNREGNYLESSASSMFVYFLYKAMRHGYIDKSYRTVADNGYDGIIKNFIRENPDGTISITQCCAVAGLGGSPYRDGSYEYYIGEKIVHNDPKAIGPFIGASIEHEMIRKK